MKPGELQIGDRVRVNERTTSGKPLPHAWSGEVVKIHTAETIANVKDTNPNSAYYDIAFPRFVRNLERSHP